MPKGADTAAVKEAVTAAVLAEGFAGATAWDVAVQRLSPMDAAGRVMSTMLLLDNCEHVIASAGAVIADLLDVVPGLTILATSREPVGYIDEQIETVPPLSAKQSLELFRQRAELAGHAITEPGQSPSSPRPGGLTARSARVAEPRPRPSMGKYHQYSRS